MYRTVSRGSVAPLAVLGTGLALIFSLLLAGSSTSAGSMTPVNGGFEAGRTGWTAARDATSLAISDRGRRDTQALRIDTSQLAGAAASPTRRVTDGSAAGTAYVWSAWMRTNRTGLPGRLVVREFLDGEIVGSQQATVGLVRGSWVQVRVPVTRERTGSAFSALIGSPWQRPSDTLLVDDVLVERRVAGAGPTLSNGCATSARGIPSCGAFLGSAYGSNTEPSPMEEEMGSRLGIRRTFFTGAQVDSAVTKAGADLRAGRLPWISFKLPYSWAEMANGRGDAWARGLASRLAALPGPVWVAFHHEPEGDGDIQAWRRMQERLAPIVRGTAPNVAFTVIVTGWHQFYGDSDYSLDAIWPRVKVDVAGFDIYNQYGVVKDGEMNTRGTNLRTDYFEKISVWAKAQGVAWGVAETGFTDRAAQVYPHWVAENYRALDQLGGVAFTYFNTTLNSIANWALTTEPKRDSYREAALGSPVLPRL